MRRSSVAMPLVAALLLGGAPALAAGADQAAELEALRAADLRVAAVEYRLATHALGYCTRTEPRSGLLVQDLSQYQRGLRGAAAAVFHLDQGPAVEAVVPDGPAARAGVRANDVVQAIGDRPVQDILRAVPAEGQSFGRTQALIDAIDAALAQGPLRLGLLRDGRAVSAVVTGQTACASRIQLLPSRKQNAGADGRIVTLSTAILDDTRDDDELAFLIGHEMSHNILGHHVRLEGEGVSFGMLSAFGGGAAKIRETEEEADYLGVYIMARAGYDPSAAARFWVRFNHAHGAGIFSDGTHLNGAKRIRFLTLAADEVLAKQRAGAPLTPDIPNAVATFP